MENGIANAFAFGALLRNNPEADAAYENSTSQQKQSILLEISSASPESLQRIVSSLENSAR